MCVCPIADMLCFFFVAAIGNQCDKAMPCGSCVRRGMGSECRLAENDPALPRQENPHEPKRMASAGEFDALRQSLASVRARVFHIESALSAFVPSTGPDGEVGFSYKPEDTPNDRSHPDTAKLRGRSESQVNSPAEPLSTIASHRASSDVASEVEAAVTLEFLVSSCFY